MRLFLSALLLLCAGSAAGASNLTGDWLVQDRTAVVSIAPCGASLCGSIARILLQKPGMPKTDVKNPNPSLRSKPLIGLRILSGFARRGERWEGGRIYDPESGKSYASKLRLNPDGSLNVSGCIAFFCQTQRWTRAR